ncbi:hypothetical protein [Subtercola lobariae]|uniref:ATP synthase F0 subunit B n=1 Tax=Subtercola lobariae TaxID=1588641 RepID=A0A917F1M2_9MICO|nr:hypothetical protein [Subtercola lobariae]GGF41431.1 hypothetical protein GCM10011399_37640 [Subtercola lobariae]
MSDNYDLPAAFYPPETSTLDAPSATFEGSASNDSDGTTDLGETAKAKAETARDQAGQLKDQAVASGSQVAGAAKDAAGDVVGEAKTQVKDLFGQAESELKDQAQVQQKRIATGLRAIADELGEMVNGSTSGGVATDLAQQAASRAGSAASWLDARDPGTLLRDVRAYAARRPGTFIAVAAIAGLAAGRLAKNLAGAAVDEKAAEARAATPTYDSTGYATTIPATSAPLVSPASVDEPVYLGDEFGGAPVDEPLYGAAGERA